MANTFFTLVVPTIDGTGTAVDLSTAGAMKTIVVGVTPDSTGQGMRCTLNLEISNAAVAPVTDDGWSPIATFAQPGDQTIAVDCKWMRVRRSNSKTPAGQPDVKVGSTNDGASLLNLPAGTGDGSSAAQDSSLLGPFKTVQVAGTFNGTVNVEISEDGTFFSPGLTFYQNGQKSLAFVARFMRVTRSGTPAIAPGQPTVNVAASAMPGGGGGGSSSSAQRFTYTATGAEGSDFNVALPVARASDTYTIQATQGDAASILGFHFPNTLAGDRTLTQFRVVTTAAVTAGDTFMFTVDDPT